MHNQQGIRHRIISLLFHIDFSSFIYLFLKFYFIFKLYIIVLVLPNIKMNPPQVYMRSPSWTLLPPHTIPLGHPSALAPSIQYRASNLDWQLVSYMIFYMFQCHSPKFSFWLTSLCIIGSSFIHLIRTDSNVFFLMAE